MENQTQRSAQGTPPAATQHLWRLWVEGRAQEVPSNGWREIVGVSAAA